jgi:hypothetical protein
MTRKPQLLLALLLLRLRRPGGAAQRRFQMMNLEALDPMPLGPGWFDSSWELEMGLEVCEASPVDAQLEREFEAMKCERAAAPAAAPRVTAPAARVAAPSPRVAAPAAQNLIEFEVTDLASWSLPARREPAQRGAELELALV